MNGSLLFLAQEIVSADFPVIQSIAMTRRMALQYFEVNYQVKFFIHIQPPHVSELYEFVRITTRVRLPNVLPGDFEPFLSIWSGLFLVWFTSQKNLSFH